MAKRGAAGKIIGVVIIAVIVLGALGYFLVKSGTIKLSGGGSGAEPEPVKAQGLDIAPASGYSLDTVNLDGESVPVIRVPLDTWGGYAAIFAANGGSKPSKDSLFYKKGKFAVEFVHTESAKEQLDGFAQGKFLVLWSSMDSLPLLYDALKADRRVVPQVFGIFDWSTGGDGIVVKQGIKLPKDLKGKTVLTSGNTPYNFFLLWLLAQSGMGPSDVKMLYLPDGPAAAKAFKSREDIDAWVTWSPFLEEISDPKSGNYVKGARSLISSRDANQLIADIYFTRLDFAREHPEILTAFVEAMLEGVDVLASNPEPAYAAMAQFYSLEGGAAEARDMVKTVHIANFPETRMFLDVENPINAYKIFFMAKEYYKAAGVINANADIEAESVINTVPIEAIAKKGLFASQKNTVISSFNKQASYDISDLENQKIVLAEDMEIHFDAQRVDFDIDSSRAEMKRNRASLEKITEQMAILGTTVVKLIGHLDTSKVEEFKQKGQQEFIEASAQAKLLSKKRAEFIKKVLVERYKCDPERIVTEGKGWEQPIDATDHAANRRVEVRFLSFE
jgi:ABC-type nitrate/sulfonate/bicarbonate transport system substrate-binding protein